MKATYPVEFEIDLSNKERKSLGQLIGKCEVEKAATLTVRISVELAQKLPQPEAPRGQHGQQRQ